MRYLVPAGRFLYTSIFLTTFGHFSSQAIGYATQRGVPAPRLLVPLSGVIALAGALSSAIEPGRERGCWCCSSCP